MTAPPTVTTGAHASTPRSGLMAVVVMCCALCSAAGVADVQPGDVVTKANAAAVAEI